VFVTRDADVAGNDDPVAFRTEAIDPIDVGHVGWETVAEMGDGVATVQGGKRLCPGRRKVVVEEELQAASFCSNSTA
jgi:hypothetical protein